ncbi:MAG TPA: ABC-2 transporter permease [Sedimentisphaerales bacterium]|nr:ABC-2 transporter permease [Sedimentisphaerales bacterium]
MKILWKEWHQQKWLIIAGLLAGITLPIFEWFHNRQDNSPNNTTETGSIAILACGVLFAIILSAASTHCDLKKGTDNFWQSKPLTAHKLFITKFLTAAILLLLAFLFVQSIDFITNSRRDSFPILARTALTLTYPIALIMFSLTMFLMAIIRDTAKTVLLAIWAALLIYFLPLLTNTLQWLNIFEVMKDLSRTCPEYLRYLLFVTFAVICSASSIF